jgi:hypothetical protein
MVDISRFVASLLWSTSGNGGPQRMRIVFKPDAIAREVGNSLAAALEPFRFFYARGGRLQGQPWRTCAFKPLLAKADKAGVTVYFERDGEDKTGVF